MPQLPSKPKGWGNQKTRWAMAALGLMALLIGQMPSAQAFEWVKATKPASLLYTALSFQAQAALQGKQPKASTHSQTLLSQAPSWAGNAYLNPLLTIKPLNLTLPQLPDFSLNQVELPLLETTSGGLTVPVVMQGKSRQLTTLLVDTGATYTVITPGLAHQLKLDEQTPVKTLLMHTANGSVEVPVYSLPRLQLGNYEVTNVEVVVQPLNENLGFAGLLGMNVLKDVEITLKKDRLVLTLPTTEP